MPRKKKPPTDLHLRSKWHYVPTKIIRIPERFEAEILEFAHRLDAEVYRKENPK